MGARFSYSSLGPEDQAHISSFYAVGKSKLDEFRDKTEVLAPRFILTCILHEYRSGTGNCLVGLLEAEVGTLYMIYTNWLDNSPLPNVLCLNEMMRKLHSKVTPFTRQSKCMLWKVKVVMKTVAIQSRTHMIFIHAM